jgi:hypothetical protein
LFVALGSQLLPSALDGAPVNDAASSLTIAFLLNIAIILFGWRRSKELRHALDAYEEAERSAQRNANPTTGLANRREPSARLGMRSTAARAARASCCCSTSIISSA